jgi:hypothetical protein
MSNNSLPGIGNEVMHPVDDALQMFQTGNTGKAGRTHTGGFPPSNKKEYLPMQAATTESQSLC